MTHRSLALALALGGLLGSACRTPPAVDLAALPGPWAHHQIDAAGLPMHALAAGPQDAPRVLLLHGFPDLSYGWRGVIPLLSEDHRVWAPDLRGYGATGRPETGYELAQLADDIAAFIRAANEADGLPADTPVHLIGHDWGSFIGWTLSYRAPGLLQSYTAISVPHPLAWRDALAEDDEQRRRARYQDQLANPAAAGLLAGVGRNRLRRLYTDEMAHDERFTDEQLDVYQSAFDTRDDWDPPLRYYRSLKEENEAGLAWLEEQGPVSLPVLVLWGAEDGFLYSRHAERSCGYVAPGPCEVEVFPELGHFPQWDDPEAVVTRWRQFQSR